MQVNPFYSYCSAHQSSTSTHSHSRFTHTPNAFVSMEQLPQDRDGERRGGGELLQLQHMSLHFSAAARGETTNILAATLLRTPTHTHTHTAIHYVWHEKGFELRLDSAPARVDVCLCIFLIAWAKSGACCAEASSLALALKVFVRHAANSLLFLPKRPLNWQQLLLLQ